MAEDLNNVFLLGRLTRDIEISYTANGFALGKLSLAVNRRRKNGEHWEDEANFFDLVLWGKRAESLQRYLIKGTQIAVQGQLKQDRWEQDGQKRSRVVIELNNIQLVGGRAGSESSVASPSYGRDGREGLSYNNGVHGGAHSAMPGSGVMPPPEADTFEDDIPF